MHVPKLHAREPRDPVVIRRRKGTDRWEKAMSYKTHVYDGRESSSGIVLTKRLNAGQGGPKGTVEGRLLAKESVALADTRTGQRAGRVGQQWLGGERKEATCFGALLQGGNRVR